MILDSTFYKNISRKVVSGGTGLVFPNDVVLLCDTNSGAINLTLCDIPFTRWNTIYKLYVVDNGNNASVNNIIVNAPVGYKINGQPFITINTNGDTYLIRITNDTNYLGTSNYFVGGSGNGHIIEDEGIPLPQQPTLNFTGGGVTAFDDPLNFETVVNVIGGIELITNANLLTLINTSTVIPSQIYQITDAIFITNYFATQQTVPVIVKGISINSVSLEGSGIFLNADYQQVGDYSGLVGFVANIGVWNSSLLPVAGDVAMWENKHYVNTTGVNTITSPNVDIINWKIGKYQIDFGYIQEIDFVTYDVYANVIRSRKDKRNNYVENNFGADTYRAQTFNVFQWGNNKVAYNSVTQNSALVCYQNQVIGGNLPTVNDLGIYGNVIQNDAFIGLDLQGNFGAIRFNQVNGKLGSIQIQSNKGSIEYNIVINSSCQVSTADTSDLFAYNYILNSTAVCFITNTLAGFIENEIKNSSVIITSHKGLFYKNVLDRSSINIDVVEVLGVITQNTFINTPITGTTVSSISSWTGNMTFNTFDDAIFKIDQQTGDGNFSHNQISQQSEVSIRNNAGTFLYNVMLNKSKVEFSLLSGWFGFSGAKGTGNILDGASQIFIQTLKGGIDNSTFQRLTTIQVNADCDGSFSNVDFSTISISTDNITASGSFLNITTDFGAIVTPIISEAYQNGSCLKGGYNTITAKLDMNDPLIYDLPTQTLLIPDAFRNFCGKFYLANATGQQISFIIRLNGNFYSELYCDVNSIQFNVISITPFVAQSIVSSVVAPVVINGRTLPSKADSVIFQNTFPGTLNLITETRIYA